MPFQTHDNWLRTAANLRHLTELNEKLKQLEKEIAEIKSKN
jgi:UDP-3-O-[3-hydroxymyristoyl] glucosamine N-acyltransferase